MSIRLIWSLSIIVAVMRMTIAQSVNKRTQNEQPYEIIKPIYD